MREFFSPAPVERGMKKWIFALLLAGLRLPAAGLLLLQEPSDPSPLLPPGRVPDPPPRIAPMPRPVPPRMPLQPIETTRLAAEVVIRDQVATVAVEQEVHNPNGTVCEGTFLLPVPRGAHLDGFSLRINGKPVEAELLGAEKARRVYEEIVRRSLDPALLEYMGRDLIKVRIYPIDPGSTRQLSLRYTQLLAEEAGLVQWTLPLRAEAPGARPIPSLSVHVQFESTLPLGTLYSPSHAVTLARRDDRHAALSFEASGFQPDADLSVLFSRTRADVGIDLLTHRPEAGEDGYFLLLAAPRLATASESATPKDVVFVLDSSGSMSGPKLEQAKRALRFCVENLNERDRFDILRFSTDVEPLFQQLREATPSSREEAFRFLARVRPTGGTAIHEALTQALASRPANSDRSFVIVFLTDGRPTVGITDENQIAQVVTGRGGAERDSLTRVFCFGIGTDVNTHLLDRITESTRAASAYVLANEDIEVKVSAFFARIKDPALVGLELVPPAGIRFTRLYPHPLPDLYKGQQILVAGRYSGQGRDPIRITGRLEGQAREFSREVSFPDVSTANDFLPRLWATRRVGHLLDEIRLRGESQELRDEVVALARQYAIVTPYTAYLVTEDEAR
ncbi:MAG TPA: hypothetical protein DCM86_10770, partial [Verrucomicrobiales bacterium]|nr:hypothetical protein [Verrucomicrobiales bacterium]